MSNSLTKRNLYTHRLMFLKGHWRIKVFFKGHQHFYLLVRTLMFLIVGQEINVFKGHRVKKIIHIYILSKNVPNCPATQDIQFFFSVG